MRIKTNFITNSSSSSFIVCFNEKPETIEQMKKMLFGNRQEFSHPYDDDTYWNTDTIAKVVFEETVPATAEEIFQFFYGMNDDGLYESCFLGDGKFDWERYRAQMKFIAEDKFQKFFKENAGKFIAIYEFSDNDGAMHTAMEHGDLFRNVEHIKRSNH